MLSAERDLWYDIIFKLCACECKCLQKPEAGTGSPWSGVTGGKPPSMGAGHGTLVPSKAVPALSHLSSPMFWVILRRFHMKLRLAQDVTSSSAVHKQK